MHGNIIDTYEVQGESVEYLWRSENGALLVGLEMEYTKYMFPMLLG